MRTERDLQQAIMVSLSRYQEWIGQKGRNINDCWESQGGRSEKFNPTREESLSLRIEDHLTSDLRLVVAREEEIRVNNRKGRTDITVSMTLSDRVLRVIIEHKKAHNPEVLESLDAQLIERYLKPSGCQTGIYLVSWFDGMAASQNKITNQLGANSIKEARTILQNQASSASAASDRDVESFVLDCSDGDRPA